MIGAVLGWMAAAASAPGRSRTRNLPVEPLPLRAAPAAARAQELRTRGQHPGLLELIDVAEAPRDAARIGLLLGQDQRDRRPAAAGPARAACAVHVALVLCRRVEVDHVRDVVEIEASRGDVGGHEHADLAGLELPERPLSGVLAPVSVHRGRTHSVACELRDEPVRSALRPHEDERRVGAAEVLDERLDLRSARSSTRSAGSTRAQLSSGSSRSSTCSVIAAVASQYSAVAFFVLPEH